MRSFIYPDWNSAMRWPGLVIWLPTDPSADPTYFDIVVYPRRTDSAKETKQTGTLMRIYLSSLWVLCKTWPEISTPTGNVQVPTANRLRAHLVSTANALRHMPTWGLPPIHEKYLCWELNWFWEHWNSVKAGNPMNDPYIVLRLNSSWTEFSNVLTYRSLSNNIPGIDKAHQFSSSHQ